MSWFFQAKRVVIYLGRARPDRLLEELINELQTIETMSCLIERTETPPFFRVTSLRKVSSHWGESGSEASFFFLARSSISGTPSVEELPRSGGGGA